VQFSQQHFAAHFFVPLIEDNALQVTGAQDFAHPHGADEHIVLPVGEGWPLSPCRRASQLPLIV
jgi:hypothetical protein